MGVGRQHRNAHRAPSQSSGEAGKGLGPLLTPKLAQSCQQERVPAPFLFRSLPPHCCPLALLLCPTWVPAWARGAIH